MPKKICSHFTCNPGEDVKSSKELEDGESHFDNLQPQELVKLRAPLTNLVCERTFGYLDASQRRRRNCSLHNHTSIMLLKQTRKSLRVWFNGLGKGEQESLMKRIKMEGKKIEKGTPREGSECGSQILQVEGKAL